MNPLVRYWKSVLKGRRERRQLEPARVAIVSFPKSGRTWLRLLLGKALCDRYGLPADRMLDTSVLTRMAGVLPTVFTHDGSSNTEGRHLRRLRPDKRDFRDKKVLVLCRDPRDILVSCYFEATKRKGVFEGTLSEFARDPHYGIEKIALFYAQWYAARSEPEEFRALSYEGLHENTGKALRETLEFMGATDLDDSLISGAIEFCRFESMRRMESSGRFAESRRMRPGESGDTESYKTRRGKVGGYTDYLSGEDLAFAARTLEQHDCPLFSSYAR